MDPKKISKQLKLLKVLLLITTSLLVGATIFILTQEDQNNFKDPNGGELTITQEMLVELFEFNDVVNISDQKMIEKWEKLNANIDSANTGRKIKLESVVSKKDSFDTWNKKKFNFVKEITPFGFAFGKQRIRKMLTEIDSTNRELLRLQKQDSLIFGVRAYLTFSNNQQGRRSRHFDLVFVPIMKNGHSYYDLSGKTKKALTGGDDPMLLNTSSPCPKMCNE